MYERLPVGFVKQPASVWLFGEVYGFCAGSLCGGNGDKQADKANGDTIRQVETKDGRRWATWPNVGNGYAGMSPWGRCF